MWGEPEGLDDTPDQAAAAPAVREHGERERILRHEQEDRLVAGNRAFVIERRATVFERADPPAERIVRAERLDPRLVQSARLREVGRCEAEQVGSRRPEPA